jgi:hypothetical protein
MKYETPELTALTPTAIDAIQASNGKTSINLDSPVPASNDVVAGYTDWEE